MSIAAAYIALVADHTLAGIVPAQMFTDTPSFLVTSVGRQWPFGSIRVTAPISVGTDVHDIAIRMDAVHCRSLRMQVRGASLTRTRRERTALSDHDSATQ